jgi:DNA-directed RNA polymerase subunit RPC12/RpoP
MWCLAAGYGDQLKTDRPEAVWICAWCVADARFPVREQPKGARCDACGWRTIGKREVIVHSFGGPWRPVGRQPQVQIVRGRAMLIRGNRVLCNYCLEEARIVLASPWTRIARSRWPRAEIIGQGRFAVVACTEHRIRLWADRSAAHQTSIQPDALMCGSECGGNHRVEVLPDERSDAGPDE